MTYDFRAFLISYLFFTPAVRVLSGLFSPMEPDLYGPFFFSKDDPGSAKYVAFYGPTGWVWARRHRGVWNHVPQGEAMRDVAEMKQLSIVEATVAAASAWDSLWPGTRTT